MLMLSVLIINMRVQDTHGTHENECLDFLISQAIKEVLKNDLLYGVRQKFCM